MIDSHIYFSAVDDVQQCFGERKTLFDTQRYTWATYCQGGALWTAKFLGDVAIKGQGTQDDYWDYEGLIDAGVITTATNSSYC
jgi:hypothetical protein